MVFSQNGLPYLYQKAEQMSKPDPQRGALVQAAVNNSPYYRHLRMALTEFTETGSKMELSVGPEHKNVWDTVHGGALASLIDSACGLASVGLLSETETVVTLQLQVNYLAPVKAGRLTAYGKVVHRGRTTITTEAEVFDESGTLVAKGGTIHYIKVRNG